MRVALALCLLLAACADAERADPAAPAAPPLEAVPGDSLTAEATAEGYTLRVAARCTREEALCPFRATLHAAPALLAAVSGVDYTFVPGRRTSPAPVTDATTHFAFEDRQTFGELVYADVHLRAEGDAPARTVMLEVSVPFSADVEPALPTGLRFEDRYSEQFLEGTPSGTYHFSVNLRGDSAALAGVREVEYRVPAHPTLPPSPIVSTAARDFLLDGPITREAPFSVPAEVRWADGRRSTHTISLSVR